MNKAAKVKVIIIAVVVVIAFITAFFIVGARLLRRPQMQHSINIGEFTLTDDKTWEWVTDTPITDASEKLLKEKYGREFVCSYFLYHQEFSLCIEFKAVPADEPEREFGYRIDSSNELRYDDYIEMMYRDELSEWLREGIEIPETSDVILYSLGSLTEEEVKSKKFIDKKLDNDESYCQHHFVVILLTDPVGAEKIDRRSDELIKSIRERLGCEFVLKVGTKSYYDPTRPSGAYGGVCLNSKIDNDELFYTYICRDDESLRMVDKAAEKISAII